MLMFLSRKDKGSPPRSYLVEFITVAITHWSLVSEVIFYSRIYPSPHLVTVLPFSLLMGYLHLDLNLKDHSNLLEQIFIRGKTLFVILLGGSQ